MWWHRFFISVPEILHGSHLPDLPRRNSKWRRMELQWACLIWPTPHALLWLLRTCGSHTQHDSWLLCFILLAWSAQDESSFPQRLLWPLDPYSFSLPHHSRWQFQPSVACPHKNPGVILHISCSLKPYVLLASQSRQKYLTQGHHPATSHHLHYQHLV